jgi:beta-mannosidase
VLWLRDLRPGSGWGLLDHRGRPKTALAHLRRALAPVAVWTTDERLGGIAVHVANDAPAPLRARLRVTLYLGERVVEEAVEELDLPAHCTITRDLEAMLGRFVDASWTYRFGPPAHDAIVARLEPTPLKGSDPLSGVGSHFRFPAGRPLEQLAPGELGLEGSAVAEGDDLRLTVRTRRLAYGVRIHAPGSTLSDDAFSVEPGGEHTVRVRGPAGAIELSALNLRGRVAVTA